MQVKEREHAQLKSQLATLQSGLEKSRAATAAEVDRKDQKKVIAALQRSVARLERVVTALSQPVVEAGKPGDDWLCAGASDHLSRSKSQHRCFVVYERCGDFSTEAEVAQEQRRGEIC
ncbi:hypothetical protein NQ176_g9360 [Zarea fungicola]|uniref:Uncharacterized protein n=1 Tax=Zarea fungicola TaxID=93591 RepID=A0ACC1MP57_9HYPO|nr:hypothetical protein NQ176_g9360 [Lecanicillium fungicola]